MSFLFSSINGLIFLSFCFYIWSFFYRDTARWARLIAGLSAWFSITYFLGSEYYSDFTEYINWIENPDLFLDHRDFIFSYLMKVLNLLFASEQGLKLIIFMATTLLVFALTTNQYTTFFPIVTNPRFMELLLNSFRGGVTLGLLTVAASSYKRHAVLSTILIFICFGFHVYLSSLMLIIFLFSKVISTRTANLAFLLGSLIYFFPVDAFNIFYDQMSLMMKVFVPGKDNNEYLAVVGLSGWAKLSSYIFNVMPVLVILLSNFKYKNEDMYKFSILSAAASFFLANYFPAMLRLSGVAFFTALSVKTTKLGTIILLSYSAIQVVLIWKNFESAL